MSSSQGRACRWLEVDLGRNLYCCVWQWREESMVPRMLSSPPASTRCALLAGSKNEGVRGVIQAVQTRRTARHGTSAVKIIAAQCTCTLSQVTLSRMEAIRRSVYQGESVDNSILLGGGQESGGLGGDKSSGSGGVSDKRMRCRCTCQVSTQRDCRRLFASVLTRCRFVSKCTVASRSIDNWYGSNGEGARCDRQGAPRGRDGAGGSPREGRIHRRRWRRRDIM